MVAGCFDQQGLWRFKQLGDGKNAPLISLENFVTEIEGGLGQEITRALIANNAPHPGGNQSHVHLGRAVVRDGGRHKAGLFDRNIARRRNVGKGGLPVEIGGLGQAPGEDYIDVGQGASIEPVLHGDGQ